MIIEFKCPKCRGHKIEEIMVDMTVATEVSLEQTGAGIECFPGEQNNEGGHVDRYQCGDCGYTIINHESDLENGLDEFALADAIQKLNATRPAPGVTLITHATTMKTKWRRRTRLGHR